MAEHRLVAEGWCLRCRCLEHHWGNEGGKPDGFAELAAQMLGWSPYLTVLTLFLVPNWRGPSRGTIISNSGTTIPADELSDGGEAVPRAAIVATGLTKSFDTPSGQLHALGPIDIEIAEGEFICVVGPSGCGKSTLVRVIAGLLPPSTGQLDVNLRGVSPTAIATVFQDFGIFPWKTVRANLELGLLVRGTAKKEARARADDWLGRLGLRGFADAYPSALSGGMRQRVAIGRALALEPEILLMDEPFASLDAQLREVMQEELLALCQAERRTVIFVTHSLEEALVLGDRVLVMTSRPGRFLDDKRVPFERPRSADIRESPEFTEMRGELWEHLRAEVQGQLGRDD